MRPIRKSWTPAAASLTGFRSNATALDWALTATSAADGLAHLVTVRNDSATNHSAKTAVLTGTDADGKPQTETINLPDNAATVTSTKFFLTLESVVPSATINADTMDVGWSAVAAGQTTPLEWRSNAVAAMTVDISGTINFTVEQTFANVYDSAPSTLPWVPIASPVDMDDVTADTTGTATLGAQAVRFYVNSVTAGATATLYLVQPGGFTL